MSRDKLKADDAIHQLKIDIESRENHLQEAENKITDFEKLSGFNVDGYKYSKAESTATTPVFLRKA